MKLFLEKILQNAVAAAYRNKMLTRRCLPEIQLEEPRQPIHGDFSTNLALAAAGMQKMPPRKIAEAIVASIEDASDTIAKVEIAGPGFINFFIKTKAWAQVLNRIHGSGSCYGASDMGKGTRIQVEFVSSNPTGPLHVGHGRGAAVGDSMARILQFCGYQVQKEYYVNDSGRQIQTLGRSVFLRYRQRLGHAIDFPADCYQGDYIAGYAGQILDHYGAGLVNQDEDAAVHLCARYTAERITAQMRQDLIDFGVVFDEWFSEQSLYDSGAVDQMIAALSQQGLIYDHEGALWFKSTAFGDEKDRVVVRANGQTTYFASDIAYHHNKYQRGFDSVIDVWGADHHGYIARVAAAVDAMGWGRDRFNVILVQLVNLLRAGQPVAMSTRAGEFVTLRQVFEEVGRDAARFIFLTRSADTTLDFDLDLAKQQTNDNPVYYVQYVHARITSMIGKASARAGSDRQWVPADGERLDTTEEVHLMKALARFPAVVAQSALQREPHRIAYYLMELAALFHGYYNRHRVLSEDERLTQARLYLVTAVRQVIANGLNLLGVSAPDKM
jgi:arginyl-tRNA synthetase